LIVPANILPKKNFPPPSVDWQSIGGYIEGDTRFFENLLNAGKKKEGNLI